MSGATEVGIQVVNEIGPLRDVVVRRPGLEISHMTQHELELLLFDDILSPVETQREHDVMTDILRGAGARVHGLESLLRRALRRAPIAETRRLLAAVCVHGGVEALTDHLLEWSPERLAIALIAGLHWSDIPGAPQSLARVRARLFDRFDMALRPTPNLMFMRDPCIAIGDQIVVGNMCRRARGREPELVRFSLRWGLPSGFGPPLTPIAPDGARHLTLEGGDVLVPSHEWIMIGCSERTSAEAIERLAERVLFPNLPALERVYAVLMPAHRSLMHLDTILTQIDDGLFLGHEPLIAGSKQRGEVKPLPVARLQREREAELLVGATVLDVLREEFGAKLQLVPCGGQEIIQQEREQWTDGANAVCVAPGKIILYSRNSRTIAELLEHGFAERRISAVLSSEQRAELIADGMQQARAVFSFSGSELSRARGGGRCLTMPLRRERLAHQS